MVTCGNCSYKKSSRDEHHFCVGCSGCSSEATCHARMNWHMDFWSYVAKMYLFGGKKLDTVSLCPSSTSFVDMDGILPNDPCQRTETMMADAETGVSSLARVAAVTMSSTVPSHSVAFDNDMMSGRLTSPRPAGPNSHSHVRTERTLNVNDNQEIGRLSLLEEGEIVNDYGEREALCQILRSQWIEQSDQETSTKGSGRSFEEEKLSHSPAGSWLTDRFSPSLRLGQNVQPPVTPMLSLHSYSEIYGT